MKIAYCNLLVGLLSEVSFIVDYFKYKNINNAIILQCNKPDNVICKNKMFFKSGFKISNLNYNNNCSYEKIISNYEKVGVVVNTSCPEWWQTLDFIPINQPTYVWLIFTEDFNYTVDVLRQYQIEIQNDVVVIYRSNNSYILHEVYNTGYFNNGTWVVNEVGYWNSKLYLVKHWRANLSGVILESTVVVTKKIVNETFIEYLRKSKQTGVDSLHKLKFFILLKYLQDMYGFSFQLQRTNSWGYLNNGSFDGMVGVLQRGEADIGGTPVFIRADRAKFIDYSIETWQSRPCFFFRHPKHPGGYLSIYTRPLADTVWYVIIATLALSAVTLCFMMKLKAIKIEGDENESSWSLAYLSIWSAWCQQGITVKQHSTSIRILIFVTFLFTLTLYQYYNATVVSTLLKESPKTIKTLNDLLESNLKAGVEDVLYNKDFFKRTTDPIALELYHKKICHHGRCNFFRPEQGMRLVQNGGFAFHVDSVIAYHIMKNTFKEQEICDVQEISLYPPQNMAAVMKKGSPYKEHITYGIRKMLESGLMHRLKTTWADPKPVCVHTPDSSLISVSLREFSTALFLLVLGMFASIMILIFEVILYYKINLGRVIEFHH